jgi:carboxylate-amine ligase
MNDELPEWRAFSGYGIELEYMIVDRADLSVAPIADRLLALGAGERCAEVCRGQLGWSNELVLHVIEVKNRAPSPSLAILPAAFETEVRHINSLLGPLGACLMPGAMHPWMDPRRETRLWPHDNEAIYRTYGRIFDTRSHGWANLQSMHINLPFAGDAEFARLHAAIRLVLPILPALAASSPIAGAVDTGCLDYRMQVYCGNSAELPSIAGMVVPETVSSPAEYEETILLPMYREIAPHDPEHVLRHEWLNSRGAIARFDRNAIEIRVVDTQECPRADLAVAAAASCAVQDLYHSDQAPLAAQQSIATGTLAGILHACIRDAEQAVIDDAAYLALFGYPGQRCQARELWRHLIGRMPREGDAGAWREPLQHILEHGPLARRILRAVGSDYSRAHLQAVYSALCGCLQDGRMFDGL